MVWVQACLWREGNHRPGADPLSMTPKSPAPRRVGLASVPLLPAVGVQATAQQVLLPAPTRLFFNNM